jgi:hypothetical protein
MYISKVFDISDKNLLLYLNGSMNQLYEVISGINEIRLD